MSFLSISRLEKYVLRESVLPFILGFSLVTFLFVIDFLFDYLDLLLTKGVPPLVVLELFLLALGWITALSFPCGVLVAALMTFGRLAQDNEITAMRGLGVNMARVLRGPLIAGAVMGIGLGLFNNYVLPETNHRFANLTYSIHRKSPAARIEPGVFIQDFENYSLLVKEIDDKSGEMTDVTIYDYTEKKSPTTILAQKGQMKYIDGGATLRLDLYDGEVHAVPGEATENKYRRLAFDQQTLFLHNAGAVLKRQDRRSRGEREMNIPAMEAAIAKLVTQKEEKITRIKDKLKTAGVDDPNGYWNAAHPEGSAKVFGAAAALLGKKQKARSDTTADGRRVSEIVQMEEMDLKSIERRIDKYQVEIHKKFSIPAACVVFILLGGPLGIRMRKGGFANMAIAVGFFLLYYLMLIGGEQLADRGLFSPALAMWMPNIVLGAIGIYLTFSITGLGPGRGMR
ncbi:MAG: YjgP/YjgQ family permease [Candidatus Eisenbacteria bacterium]|uniref:YjgP/YjgQ family permease n=1 Tax=Eiseniibacteriota bacterium TaxID=2212470 RepID=A0A7Y2H3U7_UNCEI|nr:YjgP/YjgQ family permease [Candidatus Eisenbacteria bacterium]